MIKNADKVTIWLSVLAIALLTLLAILAPTGNAYAGERVDQVLDAPQNAIVSVKNTRGDVRIIGWDETRVAVEGELDDLAETLVFTVSDRKVKIDVKMPSDVNWGDGSDLTIKVPAMSRLQFSGVSTDLDVEGVDGGAQLRSVSGDISASNLAGQLLINAVSGDLKIEAVGGDISAATVSGDIQIDMQGSLLDVDSVSGDVQVRAGLLERLDAVNVSGEFTFTGAMALGGDFNLSSVSGDIRLEFTDAPAAVINVAAGAGGDIENALSVAEAEKQFPMGQRLKAKVGDGAGNINIRTVSADVKLELD